MTKPTTSKDEFRWVTISSKDELEAFYISLLPKIREVAERCGYAIGLHGSLRRDLDLMAVVWSEMPTNKDTLAIEIHRAACGIQRQKYIWEEKPNGRMATCFPICFPTFDHGTLSLGHIDLSVVDASKQEHDAQIAAMQGRIDELGHEVHVLSSCPNEQWECAKIQKRLEERVSAIQDRLEVKGLECLRMKSALQSIISKSHSWVITMDTARIEKPIHEAYRDIAKEATNE